MEFWRISYATLYEANEHTNQAARATRPRPQKQSQRLHSWQHLLYSFLRVLNRCHRIQALVAPPTSKERRAATLYHTAPHRATKPVLRLGQHSKRIRWPPGRRRMVPAGPPPPALPVRQPSRLAAAAGLKSVRSASGGVTVSEVVPGRDFRAARKACASRGGAV